MTTERIPRYTEDGVREILGVMEGMGYIKDWFIATRTGCLFITLNDGTEFDYGLDWFRAELAKVDPEVSSSKGVYQILWFSKRYDELFALFYGKSREVAKCQGL